MVSRSLRIALLSNFSAKSRDPEVDDFDALFISIDCKRDTFEGTINIFYSFVIPYQEYVHFELFFG